MVRRGPHPDAVPQYVSIPSPFHMTRPTYLGSGHRPFATGDVSQPGYTPPLPPLFGEKEGKIARASRGRDPLYLFAALQRQLGYPEVPRARPRDDPLTQLLALKAKLETQGAS